LPSDPACWLQGRIVDLPFQREEVQKRASRKVNQLSGILKGLVPFRQMEVKMIESSRPVAHMVKNLFLSMCAYLQLA
jgi:hypothetical protein